MASNLSIKGKQVIILCPRVRVKCVSLVYHESRAASIGTKSVAGQDVIEQELNFTRHVSVVYISVRLIISATWVRHIPFAVDVDSHVDKKFKSESITTDEGLLHEGMFVFDKAFAQEIKYLFAELDFDLYMCRDKQGGVRRRQVMPRRIPIWRPKEQYSTFVYFVRQNSGMGSDGRGETVEQADLNRVLETFSDKLKNDGRYLNTGKEEECDHTGTLEEYLQQFEAEDTTAASLRNEHIGRNGREITKIEDYLRMCEKERVGRDITIEEYLRQLEKRGLSNDVTVEEYLRAREEEPSTKDMTVEEYLRSREEEPSTKDMTVEEYLRSREEEPSTKDMTVEEYLRSREEEPSTKDMTVEEYLRSREEEPSTKDMTVEEYLRSLEEELSTKDMTVEEYLRSREEEPSTRDMTVEEYLRSLEEELSTKDVTVEEYLRSREEEPSTKDMTVEEYLRSCEEELSTKDVTVEEYLRLQEEEKLYKDTTVEEYLILCKEKYGYQDMTVEEYLKLNDERKTRLELTVEEYIRSCEEEKENSDITIEEYLRLMRGEISEDITIEQYLKLCAERGIETDLTVEEYLRSYKEEISQGMTVEEYLKSFSVGIGSTELTIEEYLKLCEEEREKNGVPVEEYLRLAEANLSQDMTVEKYLELCNENKAVMELTIEEYVKLCEEEREKNGVPVEEYLRLAEANLSQDMTVEEYLELCNENKAAMELTIEEYVKLCEEEREKNGVPVEEYLNLWADERNVRDVTVEEYIELYKYFRSCSEVSVEEYLRLCDKARQEEDMTVEEYIRLYEEGQETMHPKIEEYTIDSELERIRKLPSRDCMPPIDEAQDGKKVAEEDSETWDDLKYALFGDLTHKTRESYKVSEDVLHDESAHKYLRHDTVVSSEEEQLSAVKTLFLPKISLHDQPDEEDLAKIPFKELPRNNLEAETEEEDIVESAVSHVESSEGTWMNFDMLDMAEEGIPSARPAVEEDLIGKASVISSNEDVMEEVLKRHGLWFSAELWLLFPVYRRTPWINISVLYRDNVQFDWGISHVIEAEAEERTVAQDVEAANAFEEETIESQSMDTSTRVAVEEDDVVVDEMISNFAEIEFTFLDCIDENENNNNTTTNYNEAYSNGYEKEVESEHVPGGLPKKMAIPTLKQPRCHGSDEQINKSRNIHFAPITNLSKKGLVYRSKERIFTGSEVENKLVWNSLEKIHCKHAKAVNVPETLRRTVSKNNLDILESSNEDEDNIHVIQQNENELPRALLISPLRIEHFGKNLKESNV